MSDKQKEMAQKAASKFNIAEEFTRGYAAAIECRSCNPAASEHWKAGWNAGYYARTEKNKHLNAYLVQIGLGELATMNLARS